MKTSEALKIVMDELNSISVQGITNIKAMAMAANDLQTIIKAIEKAEQEAANVCKTDLPGEPQDTDA